MIGFERLVVRDVDTLVDKISRQGRGHYADIGAAEMSMHGDHLLALLELMAVDHDGLAGSSWKSFAADTSYKFDSTVTVEDALGVEQGNPDTDLCFFDINSSENPFLRSAYLAFYGLSYGQRTPIIGQKLYDERMLQLRSAINGHAVLDQECLGALEQDQGLQRLITTIHMRESGPTETVCGAHELLAGNLGAGAVSLFLNEQLILDSTT